MVKQAEKEKPFRIAILPAMGFILAIVYGVIAFFASPLILGLVEDQMGEYQFEQRFGETDEDQQTIRMGLSAALWVTLFAISMLIVAAFLNEDPDKEDSLIRPRRDASEKEWVKYEKKLAQIQARRLKRAKEVEAQQKKANK
jgi:hypothetical protein